MCYLAVYDYIYVVSVYAHNCLCGIYFSPHLFMLYPSVFSTSVYVVNVCLCFPLDMLPLMTCSKLCTFNMTCSRTWNLSVYIFPLHILPLMTCSVPCTFNMTCSCTWHLSVYISALRILPVMKDSKLSNAITYSRIHLFIFWSSTYFQ